MATYTARDVAEFLTGGDGELDDLHPDCPKLGIAGPLDDDSLRVHVYVDGHDVARYRVTITPEA